ncbi:MAG TPA: hypothetical protein VG711_12580 [Phycisphaerales bacterium]|nr:hypothetical protein [Phycisphaerales bacterium]
MIPRLIILLALVALISAAPPQRSARGGDISTSDATAATVTGKPGDTYTFIRNDLSTLHARLGAVTSQVVEYLDDSSWSQLKTEDCLALINESPPINTATSLSVLTLNDGQRFPGEVVSGETPSADIVAWNHPRLGRLSIPINLIASVTFQPGAQIPTSGSSDVLLLSNGDRLEGFILSIADTISIELSSPAGSTAHQVSHIPLSRAVAATMVAQNRPAVGRRIWLEDGTVLDVSTLTVGLDGQVRIASPFIPQDPQHPVLVPIQNVSAVLLVPRAIVPLASIKPLDVSGPSTRFMIPPPRVMDAFAPLQASRISMSGPLKVRYPLPAHSRRFSATASLARDAQVFGDCDLVISCDGKELSRTHLSPDQPAAAINVPAAGAEMTIDLMPGANGSIQDHVILSLPIFSIDTSLRQ